MACLYPGGATANSEESELGQGLGGEVVGWSDSYRKVDPIGAPQHHPTTTNARSLGKMNFTQTLTPPMSSSLWKHKLVNNYKHTQNNVCNTGVTHTHTHTAATQ